MTKRDRKVRLVVIGLLVLNVLDIATTEILLRMNFGHEVNPVALFWFKIKIPGLFYLIKMVVISICCYVIWVRRNKPSVFGTAIFCFVIYLCLIIYHTVGILLSFYLT